MSAKHRKYPPSCVPPKSVLRLLEPEERARLLLMIARALGKGLTSNKGDRKFVKRLALVWPGMVPPGYSSS